MHATHRGGGHVLRYDKRYFDFMWQLMTAAAPSSAEPDAGSLAYPEGGVTSEEDAVAKVGPLCAVLRVPRSCGCGCQRTSHTLWCGCLQGGAAMRTTLLGFTFVLETLPASTDKDALPRWAGRLRGLVTRNVVAALWLLQRLATNRKLLQVRVRVCVCVCGLGASHAVLAMASSP